MLKDLQEQLEQLLKRAQEIEDEPTLPSNSDDDEAKDSKVKNAKG